MDLRAAVDAWLHEHGAESSGDDLQDIALARLLRGIADRIDYGGAPRYTGWFFTFEQREGIRFRQDGRGCPVWYLGMQEYHRAHDEADTAV